MLTGQLQSLKYLTNINDILKTKIVQYFNLSEISTRKITLFVITSYYNNEIEIQFSWNDKLNQLDVKIINPDKNIKCKTIITKCLYFTDLTSINIFITTEILKCEIQSKPGLEDIDYLFNSNIGNTLKLNIFTKWNITNFDAVIGNPPCKDINATGDNKLYLEFTKYALNILKNNGYLLYITPRNILEYILSLDKNRKYIEDFYQINYISIKTSNKYFKNVGSTFSYFLIEKIPYNKKTIIEYLY